MHTCTCAPPGGLNRSVVCTGAIVKANALTFVLAGVLGLAINFMGMHIIKLSGSTTLKVAVPATNDTNAQPGMHAALTMDARMLGAAGACRGPRPNCGHVWRAVPG